ncbi:MAG: hypothetical protein ACE5JP_00900 [Candidatus Bipolaricaulia bacterium]
MAPFGMTVVWLSMGVATDVFLGSADRIGGGRIEGKNGQDQDHKEKHRNDSERLLT